MRILAVALLTTLLTACAGYRGGWASVPYTRDPAPAEMPPVPPDVGVPGLELRVGLNNQQLTYDQVWFLVVPVAVEPLPVMSPDADGKLRAWLNVVPRAEGWVFRPLEARIEVDGRTYVATRATRNALWNDAGQAVRAGGRYARRDVTAELPLDVSEPYQLVLEFDAPVPPPAQAKLSLDLSAAFRSPAAALPLIRFAPVRWRRGYT